MVSGKHFEVLYGDRPTMYLGKLFQHNSLHDVELRHRMGKAWAKFHIFRAELTDKKYDLPGRLRLFKAVVQPTLLYGSVSWTMTRAREQMIRTTQRKMLRRIVGTPRVAAGNEIESWVAWVSRSTRMAEAEMIKNKVVDWVEEIHRRKFRWAGRTVRQEDGRWTREVLTWSVGGTRLRKRPLKRWTDSLQQFVKHFYGSDAANENAWMEAAMDQNTWSSLETAYVDFALQR